MKYRKTYRIEVFINAKSSTEAQETFENLNLNNIDGEVSSKSNIISGGYVDDDGEIEIAPNYDQAVLDASDISKKIEDIKENWDNYRKDFTDDGDAVFEDYHDAIGEYASHEVIDSITNDLMDSLRDVFGIDSDSDADDKIYSILYNAVNNKVVVPSSLKTLSQYHQLRNELWELLSQEDIVINNDKAFLKFDNDLYVMLQNTGRMVDGDRLYFSDLKS
jgi:hypothetical protein